MKWLSVPFLEVVSGLALPLAMAGCSRHGTTPSPTADALRARLESPKRPAFVGRGRDRQQLWEEVRRFYAGRQDRPAWFDDGSPRREAAELVEAVEAAAQEGLDAADYDLGNIRSVDSAEADLHLSYVFLQYASDLLSGCVNPRELDANWVGEARRAELPDLLETALSGRGVKAALESVEPRHPQYAMLKEALRRYRAIAERGGWPTDLPPHIQLRQGERSPSVATLRARLQASDESGPSVFGARWLQFLRRSDAFDEALAKDLAHFKERHGLEPNGVLDAGAVAALNVPVRQRIRQIELNLERLRWLPDRLGARYIMVNIPAFTLEGFEDDEVALEMRVATGTKENPTPIFSERMTQVVFSPYWNIPPRIAREEWIPAAVQDPEYLRQNGLEVLKGDRVVDPRKVNWSDENLRLRQRPGAENILGLVKFVFPNRFNVYLHDTPFESDFHRAARDRSHGCVRIEKPAELAEWVLRGQGHWSRERIEAAMHAGVEERVDVERPVPVYLVYRTAWVAENHAVWFSDDPYEYDAAQLALLDSRHATGRAQGAPPTRTRRSQLSQQQRPSHEANGRSARRERVAVPDDRERKR